MTKLLVVRGDPVRGKDTHEVMGNATNPSPPPPTVAYPPSGIATGRFDYVGSMTEALSDLVLIGGRPVAVVSSGSSLDAGQDTPPGGKHSGPAGSAFQPTAPAPLAATLSITDSIGPGHPSATAGSAFVTVNGVAVLLDGDRIDTCDAMGATGNSTVSAAGQSLVTASE